MYNFLKKIEALLLIQAFFKFNQVYKKYNYSDFKLLLCIHLKLSFCCLYFCCIIIFIYRLGREGN
jgi:hypothetical protein